MSNIKIIDCAKYETDDYCVTSHKMSYNDDFAYLCFTIHCDNPLVTRHNKYFRNVYCTIQYLFTMKQYRNMGYATRLLLHLKQYCKSNNIKIIRLDDCSDNFNKQNNLYVQNGFNYIVQGYPEMRIKI
jgi:GNAT superfamily N-acetyltransferase